jgi:hypothetical protein
MTMMLIDDDENMIKMVVLITMMTMTEGDRNETRRVALIQKTKKQQMEDETANTLPGAINEIKRGAHYHVEAEGLGPA